MSDVTPTGSSSQDSAPGSSATQALTTGPSWWTKQSSAVKSAVVATAGVAATAVGLVAPNMGASPTSLDTINGGCTSEGNAAKGTWQWRANPLKNRWEIPSGESLNASATFDNLLAAPSDPNAATLPAGQFATYTGPNGITFNEDESADITGYIAEVKVGGDESCNCNTKDEPFMDTHIYISKLKGETDKSKCLIVEVTPRMRVIKSQSGVDWSTPTLMSSLKPGTQVEVSGWLFDDQEHKPNSQADPGHGTNVWRGSVWEIHPVTDIQVLNSAGVVK